MFVEIKSTMIDARSDGLVVVAEIWADASKTNAVVRNDWFWPVLQNQYDRIVTNDDGLGKGSDGNWYPTSEELPEGVEWVYETIDADKPELIRNGIADYWRRRKTREFYAHAPGVEDVQEYPYAHTDGKAQLTMDDPRGLLTEDVLELVGTSYEQQVIVRVEWPVGSGRWWNMVV